MTKRTTPQAAYETEKLTFAAYLIATNRAELIGARPIGRGKAVTFLLSKSPSNEDVTSFFNGAGTVSAIRFAESINSLKSVAYEVQRCQG